MSEDENCAVLLSRAAAQREAEHKHKVKEAWRAFEDRLLATFGEAHDRVPADAAALRDAEALVVELYGWSGALGKVGKKAQKHLQKLGRHRELGEALGLRGRNPVAHARLHELAPNERFNIAAAAARAWWRAAGARDARDERRRTRSSADSLSDAETKQSAAARLLPRSSSPTTAAAAQHDGGPAGPPPVALAARAAVARAEAAAAAACPGPPPVELVPYRGYVTDIRGCRFC